MPICPDCHAAVGDSAKFCDNCGFALQSAPPSAPVVDPLVGGARAPSSSAEPVPTPPKALGACSACGHQNLPGEMFCQNCGVQLAPVASSPPPPPRPVTGPRPLAAPVESSTDDRCASCGSTVGPRDMYCPNCGAKVRQQLASAAPSGFEPALAPSGAAPPISIPASSHAVEAEAAPPGGGLPDDPAIPAAPFDPWNLGDQAIIPPASTLPPSPAVPAGRLIVQSTGAEFGLPTGPMEMLIGRSDPVRDIYPEIDLAPHGGDHQGVSRRHARLVIGPLGVEIEDLNSTNLTFLNRQRLQPGRLFALQNGDEVRVGLLTLEYRRP